MRSKLTMLLGAVAVAGMAAAGACGDDDDDSAATTTTSTTEAAATSSTETTDTTEAPTGLAAGPDYVTTSGPSGSGCTVGEVDQLPGGWWAGKITKVYESGVDLDLACWYQGDAATAEATAKGDVATDDYYIVDDNPRTFRVEFPPGMTGSSCIDQAGERFACELNDVLQLYRVSLDQSIPTSILGDAELVAFPWIWVHVDDAKQGDYAYMQYTP